MKKPFLFLFLSVIDDANWKPFGITEILIVVEGNVRLMMGMLKYVMNELFSLSDSLLALKGDDQAMIEKGMSQPQSSIE